MTLDDLLQAMVDEQASDLFISVGSPPSIKVDGTLFSIDESVIDSDTAHDLIYGAMRAEQQEQFERDYELNFGLSREGIGRFRANVFQQQYQPGMVVRRIETDIPTVESLGLPQVLETMIMEKRGLILVVGATGVGKSTTMAAMVGHRNRHGSGHIVTVEDPIEFVHSPQGCVITQREVGVDTKSYETALQNSLRQAPDVILIGEILDRTTMHHSLVFAETGHLSLAPLHAVNCSQALERAINFFPRDRRDEILMDLSLNMRAIIAQRLVPAADGEGRVLAIEILTNSSLATDLIASGRFDELKDVMKKSDQHDMCTFEQSLFELYRDGLVTEEDALQYADSPNDLRLMIKFGSNDLSDDLANRSSQISLTGAKR
ncbi:MAG: PilT/PilU family type 4a pilus ATPase [Gammaproteobacteria bacterium]|nr:PilT/PilU family type 4a pilus ATPase [Gammaproteobacteria bacterium]